MQNKKNISNDTSNDISNDTSNDTSNDISNDTSYKVQKDILSISLKEEIIKGIEFNYQVPYITRQNGYNYIADFGYNY